MEALIAKPEWRAGMVLDRIDARLEKLRARARDSGDRILWLRVKLWEHRRELVSIRVELEGRGT